MTADRERDARRALVVEIAVRCAWFRGLLHRGVAGHREAGRIAGLPHLTETQYRDALSEIGEDEDVMIAQLRVFQGLIGRN